LPGSASHPRVMSPVAYFGQKKVAWQTLSS
jgi:hypothetical protein